MLTGAVCASGVSGDPPDHRERTRPVRHAASTAVAIQKGVHSPRLAAQSGPNRAAAGRKEESENPCVSRFAI